MNIIYQESNIDNNNNIESNKIEQKKIEEKEKIKKIIDTLFIYISCDISDLNKKKSPNINPLSSNSNNLILNNSSDFLSNLYSQNYNSIPILSENGIFHIYHKFYENFDKKKNQKFISKISKILFFCYRKNFFPINKNLYNSDS